MADRLQKIIAARGICSRRQAEKWIEAGRVRCNGQTAFLGQTADEMRDTITVDGKALPHRQANVYLMLNKPKGYVTTLSDEKGRKNAAELVQNCGTRVYPVGRLDMDSEGLLLFTNDGEFANMMMHPKHEVSKTYRVWVDHFSEIAFDHVKIPIVLDGYQIRPPQVKTLSAENTHAVLEITIHEGRNRQVRRMCAAAGMTVKKLLRISEGSLSLENLQSGCWRYLTEQEINRLKE